MSFLTRLKSLHVMWKSHHNSRIIFESRWTVFCFSKHGPLESRTSHNTLLVNTAFSLLPHFLVSFLWLLPFNLFTHFCTTAMLVRSTCYLNFSLLSPSATTNSPLLHIKERNCTLLKFSPSWHRKRRADAGSFSPLAFSLLRPFFSCSAFLFIVRDMRALIKSVSSHWYSKRTAA